MQFKDVIGQSAVKQRLIQSVRENHVSHAQLFLGPAGSGKLPLALAYAQYILCPNRTETDSCGVCPTCQKMQKLVPKLAKRGLSEIQLSGGGLYVCPLRL